MSIERLHTPYDFMQPSIDRHVVLPAFNPITLSYRSGLLGNNPDGTRAGATINVNDFDAITEGQYLEVNGVRYYFRDDPNPGDLPSKDAPGATPTLVMQALYFALNDTPALAEAYTFFVDAGGVLIIQAQNPGTVYNLALTASDAGMFLLTSTAGQDGHFAQLKEAYSVFVELFVDERDANAARFLDPAGVPFSQAQWRRVAVLKKEYSGDNEFTFDVAELVRPFLRPVPPRFVPTDAGAYPVFDTADGMLRRFAWNVGEEYQDGAILRRLGLPECMGFGNNQVTSWFWAVAAGVGLQHGDSESYIAFYNHWRRKDATPADAIFPLHQGGVNTESGVADLVIEKQSNVQALEYLYFLYDRGGDGYTHLDVRFDFYFEDGTELTNQYFDRFKKYIPQVQRYGGALYVEVSPRAWDWEQVEADNGGVRLASFAATVVEHNGNTASAKPVTVPRVYYLNNSERCVERADVLVWLNPLGGYETWLCTGAIEKEVDAERLTHEAPLQHETLETGIYTYDDYAKLADRRTYKVRARNVYNVNTGWMDEDDMALFQSIAHTTEVYLLRYDDADLLTLNVWQPRRCAVRRAEWRTRTDQDGDQYNLALELELSCELNQIAQ